MPLIVDASVTRSGEIGLERGGQLLDGRVLHGGESGGVRGEVQLVSEASVPLDVTVWDVGPPSGLEELLWVRITLDDVVLYDGSLATLRQTPSSAARIDSGRRALLAAAVSLRPGAPDTFQGRRTELLLRLESKAVGG